MSPETEAVVSCCDALDPLPDTERERVLDYLRGRYGPGCMDKIIAGLQIVLADQKAAKAMLPTRRDSAGPNSPASAVPA